MTHRRTWLRSLDWFGDRHQPRDSFAVDHLTSLEWWPVELAAVVAAAVAAVGILIVAAADVVVAAVVAVAVVAVAVDVGTVVAVAARVVFSWPGDLKSPTRLVSQPETL